MDKFVLCSEHHKLRPERYLVKRDVLNAEGAVVGAAYRCRPEDSCDKRAAERFQNQQATANQASENSSEAMKLYGGREVRGRYYDLANHDGGIDNALRKVCFACGLSDHERSTCPNLFCRACHSNTVPHAPHTCSPVDKLSDFIDTRVPTDEELAGVRCPICNGLGHLDCVPHRTVAHVVSCASCGSQGHHAFQCMAAPHDRWLEAQIELLQDALTRRQKDPVVPRHISSKGSSKVAKAPTPAFSASQSSSPKIQTPPSVPPAAAPAAAAAGGSTTKTAGGKRVATLVVEDDASPAARRGGMVEDPTTKGAVAPRAASPRGVEKRGGGTTKAASPPSTPASPADEIFTF